jgi:hypothetical protein
MIKSIYTYIKANLAGWQVVFVCMLLGDGGLLLCSGGVFFGVRSGSITWQRHLYKIESFLWGQFWGCCLADVSEEHIASIFRVEEKGKQETRMK